MMAGIEQAAVLGWGRSGKAAAAALGAHGISIVAYDEKAPEPGDIELVRNWDGVLPSGRFQLVVPSPGVRRDHPALVAAVREGLAVWSEPELGYRISKAPIWAVTGTNGKSTTTAMLHSIARAAGLNAILCGNIAGRGIDANPVSAAALVAGPNDLLVAEISSFQLEWVERFRPRLAVLTNIAWDHKDRYDGLEDYARTKQRIFAAQAPGDVAVTTVESADTGAAHRIHLGRDVPDSDCAFWRGETLVLRMGGAERSLLEYSHAATAGRLNAVNAAAAAAGAAALGIPAQAITVGIRSFHGLPNRMELVGTARGVAFFDNTCATNPDSAAAAIRALEAPTTVLVGGFDKQVPLDPLVEAARSLVRPPVVYGAIGEKLSAAFTAASIRHTLVQDLAGAFDVASRQADVGEAVALIPGCSSFDAYKDFEDRSEHFRRLVREVRS
jgi:UDP-N-acetylmuramoylalanine--D-glutamate ligase